MSFPARTLTPIFTTLIVSLSLGADKPAAPTTKPSTPPALHGDWFSGTVSPTRYWNADTGDFVGHGYSGALSYVFHPDGRYQRFYYLEQRLYATTSSIFSASEGTVAFTDKTFTLKPEKGTYKFTEGRKDPRTRPMERDELERPGLTFHYRLTKDDAGRTLLLVNKENEDPRQFRKSEEEKR